MNIVMIAENDPAGTAILFAGAINRLTDHCCRVVTCQTRYTHDFARDLHLPELLNRPGGLDELEQVLSQADVFHFHMLADEHYPLGPFTVADFLTDQLIVHHHHGHPAFRAHPERFADRYSRLGRAHLLVSTPDLLDMLPGARWMPNIVPLQDPLYRPTPIPPAPPLRLSHSPTRKDLKNTEDLLHVVERLTQGLGPGNLALDLIDDVPHAQCLARKQRSHVVFDHMQGYFGVSSLEGLSQGRAVIAGLDTANRSAIQDFFDCGSIPWLPARDVQELEDLLLELLHDPALCAEAGTASRRFMEEYWNEEFVVGRLMQVYGV